MHASPSSCYFVSRLTVFQTFCNWRWRSQQRNHVLKINKCRYFLKRLNKHCKCPRMHCCLNRVTPSKLPLPSNVLICTFKAWTSLYSFLFSAFTDSSFCKMCFSETFVSSLVDEMITSMRSPVMMTFFFSTEEPSLLLPVVASAVLRNPKEYSSKSEDAKKLDFPEAMLRFTFFSVA